MKIGIDARPLIEKKTGIGFYLYNLLENILENDKTNTYYLFSDKKIHFHRDRYENVIFIEDNNNKLFKKTLWYLFKLPKLKIFKELDLFWGTQHVLPISNKKSILTIHDLVAFRMPETMFWYNKIINKLCIPYSIKKANSIISVSKSTKNDILKYFPKTNKEKISVIYEDACIERNIEDKKNNILIENNIESKQFLLYVGTIEPRKDIETLLKAFEEIKSDNIKLVLAGKLGWKSSDFKEKLKKNRRSSDILYLDYISNGDKNILMKNCLAFIFPSLYEGFGLPVVEAIKLGSISIVSNSSSLDELIQLDELKFSVRNYNELAKKINNIIDDQCTYEKCLKYCNDRAKDFDWNNISKEYIELINKFNN